MITETFKNNDSWVTRLDKTDKEYNKFKYVSGIGDDPEESNEEFHIALEFAKEVDSEPKTKES